MSVCSGSGIVSDSQLRVRRVEQAQLDAGGVLGEQREVDARRRPRSRPADTGSRARLSNCSWSQRTAHAGRGGTDGSGSSRITVPRSDWSVAIEPKPWPQGVAPRLLLTRVNPSRRRKGDVTIAMDNDKAISTLNSLIETLKDGEEGFRTAAEADGSADQGRCSSSTPRERGRWRRSSRRRCAQLGGDPEKAGSVSGSCTAAGSTSSRRSPGRTTPASSPKPNAARTLPRRPSRRPQACACRVGHRGGRAAGRAGPRGARQACARWSARPLDASAGHRQEGRVLAASPPRRHLLQSAACGSTRCGGGRSSSTACSACRARRSASASTRSSGSIPGIGDLASPVYTALILIEGLRLRVPAVVQARMVLNAALDMLIGLVPLLGDIADVAWKANLRNLALLERHAHPGHRHRRRLPLRLRSASPSSRSSRSCRWCSSSGCCRAFRWYEAERKASGSRRCRRLGLWPVGLQAQSRQPARSFAARLAAHCRNNSAERLSPSPPTTPPKSRVPRTSTRSARRARGRSCRTATGWETSGCR